MTYIVMFMSSLMAISSTNMFMLWSSMELNMFSFIPMMLNKINTNEIEASINYFLPQALSSTILLMSSTMLISTSWFMKIAMLMLIMSILLKLGASPCFHWFPSTMEKITWPNCLLLTTWQKLAPLFILLFIVLPKTNSFITMLTATLNSMTGGIMIISQTSMKKVMSFSSITHMGWMLCGSASKTPCLSMTYFILYSLIILPLFYTLHKSNTLTTLDLWSKEKPLMVQIMIMLMILSLGGMPPTTGFIQKLLMVNILLNSHTMAITLMIFGSLMNLFFYLNISLLTMLNMEKSQLTAKNPYNMMPMMNWLLAVNSMTIMIIIL